MKFSLVNESTLTAPQFGGPLDAATLSKMAAALEIQLNRDVALYWGGTHTVDVISSIDQLQPEVVVCAILDSLPGNSGAIAYHDVQGNELPYVLLGRAMCNSLLSGPGSVSAVLSHELCETVGDPYINVWRDDGKGRMWAQELCDAVQGWGYEIDGVSVSDFVLPAFFAPGAEGPYNFVASIPQLGPICLGPLQTAPGGYQLVRSVGGATTSVWGDVGIRAEKSKHPSSRTYKRGARG